jgi:Ca-activated chloride channel homolog
MARKALAVALWISAVAGLAGAQESADVRLANWNVATRTEAPFSLRSQVAEVGVQLAVNDRSGKAVSSLTAADLQVLDNGRPAAITELRRQDDLPLRIALVIDWSDSVHKALPFERNLALELLRTMLRPGIDRATVVGFRYRVEVTQGLTSDAESLRSGVRPVGGVSLSSVYDALIAATDGLLADPSLPQRRAIVLLSDGEDNVSAHGLPDVIRAAQQANVAIYTITPRQRQATPRGEKVLRELAASTGGRAFMISRGGEQAALAAVQQDLRSGYALYFKPGSPASDGFRSLEITARDRSLHVSAPRSYYAGWE